MLYKWGIAKVRRGNEFSCRNRLRNFFEDF